MPLPSGVTWSRDPHTAAKHDLLKHYFSAWLPILFQKYAHVTYAEGFAGPGIYQGDEPGSPVIALQVLASHRTLLTTHADHVVDVFFVEEDGRRHDRLVAELGRAHERLSGLPTNIRIHPPVKGDCVEVLPPLFTAENCWGAPMFVILDSFGGPDIPFDFVKQIADNPSGEVLITFGATFLTRHGEKPEHAPKGDAAFGDTEWRAVFDQPSERKWSFLVAEYRRSLHKAGFAHVLIFEMVDEKGSRLWLLFGTNSKRGVEKMKDAMWSVDPAYGVRYRDPRDPNQMMLDIEDQPDTAPLSRILLEQLQSGALSVESLRDFTLLETVYRPQQLWTLVRSLIADGRISKTSSGALSGNSVLAIATVVTPVAEQGALF